MVDVKGYGTVVIEEVVVNPNYLTNLPTISLHGYLAQSHTRDSILNDPCRSILKVIVNGPATIIFWVDGTKTIVKYRKVGKSKDNRYVAITWAIAKKLAGSRAQLEKHICKNSKVIDKKSANVNDIVAMLLMAWLGKTPYELKKLIEDLVDKKLEVHE